MALHAGQFLHFLGRNWFKQGHGRKKIVNEVGFDVDYAQWEALDGFDVEIIVEIILARKPKSGHSERK